MWTKTKKGNSLTRVVIDGIDYSVVIPAGMTQKQIESAFKAKEYSLSDGLLSFGFSGAPADCKVDLSFLSGKTLSKAAGKLVLDITIDEDEV
jgi:hypothetical protein